MNRLKIVAIGAPIFLILGLIAGLGRLGLIHFSLSPDHGVLMLNGFAGGVITVERFLSKKDPWTFTGLLALMIGTVFYLLGSPIGLLLVAIDITILLLIEASHFSTDRLHNGIYQILALIAWFLANLRFYLDGFYPGAVPFWELFILLMIVSTRLSKIDRQDVISLVLVIAIFSSFWLSFHGSGQSVYGIGVVLLSIRLCHLELSGRSNHRLAVALTYGWLFISGLGAFFSDYILYSYDLTLHAFFLGFFFSMIFINAPEALLDKLGFKQLKTLPNFWVTFLSIGLIVRLILGDYYQMHGARNLGGILNTITILAYMASILFQVIRLRFTHPGTNNQ